MYTHKVFKSFMSLVFFSNLLLKQRNIQLNIFSQFTLWVSVINVLMAHLANTTPLPINVMEAEC